MAMSFTELQCKEVICVRDGRRLGFVSDVRVELPEGKICALVVPCPAKLFGIPGRKEEYLIPWSAIRRIGPDIVLVDTTPEDCRSPRPHKGLPF